MQTTGISSEDSHRLVSGDGLTVLQMFECLRNKMLVTLHFDAAVSRAFVNRRLQGKDVLCHMMVPLFMCHSWIVTVADPVVDGPKLLRGCAFAAFLVAPVVMPQAAS